MRPAKLEGNFKVAIRHHRLDIGVPGPARVLAEFVGEFVLQQIDGAFHIGRCEWLAIVPFHPWMQPEGEGFLIVTPCPAISKFGGDGFRGVLRDILAEQHEIIEHAHEGDVVGEGGFFDFTLLYALASVVSRKFGQEHRGQHYRYDASNTPADQSKFHARILRYQAHLSTAKHRACQIAYHLDARETPA